MTASDALNTPRKSQAKGCEILVIKKIKISIQWIGKQIARSKKEKKASLKREKARSHKVTLNALIMASRGIISEITTRNRSKIKELERKSKSKTRNGSLNRKNIRKENGTKPEKIKKRKLSST
jgi:hypothetical protein